MFKKVSLLFVFTGLLCNVPVIQANSLNDAIKSTTKSLNDTFGKERSKSGALVQRLTIAFLQGGLDAKDRSFDALKGATSAVDGFAKAAMEYMVCNAAGEAFRESYKKAAEMGLLKKNTDDVLDKIFKDYLKIFSKVGLDFAVQGLKYANNKDIQDKNVQKFLKLYLPRFAKKMAVYWSFFGIKFGMAKTETGRNILALWTAAQVIPFFGIFIEDAPEELLEKGYDISLAQAKKLAEIIKQKMDKQAQPALA